MQAVADLGDVQEGKVAAWSRLGPEAEALQQVLLHLCWIQLKQ